MTWDGKKTAPPEVRAIVCNDCGEGTVWDCQHDRGDCPPKCTRRFTSPLLVLKDGKRMHRSCQNRRARESRIELAKGVRAALEAEKVPA